MQAIPRRTGLVGKDHACMPGRQRSDQPGDCIGRARDAPVKPYFPSIAARGNADRDRLLADIQSNICGILIHGSSPMSESMVDRLTLATDMSRDEPPSLRANMTDRKRTRLNSSN